MSIDSPLLDVFMTCFRIGLVKPLFLIACGFFFAPCFLLVASSVHRAFPLLPVDILLNASSLPISTNVLVQKLCCSYSRIHEVR